MILHGLFLLKPCFIYSLKIGEGHNQKWKDVTLQIRKCSAYPQKEMNSPATLGLPLFFLHTARCLKSPGNFTTSIARYSAWMISPLDSMLLHGVETAGKKKQILGNWRMWQITKGKKAEYQTLISIRRPLPKGGARLGVWWTSGWAIQGREPSEAETSCWRRFRNRHCKARIRDAFGAKPAEEWTSAVQP